MLSVPRAPKINIFVPRIATNHEKSIFPLPRAQHANQYFLSQDHRKSIFSFPRSSKANISFPWGTTNLIPFLSADQVCRLILKEIFAFKCLSPLGMIRLPFTYEPTSAEVELLDYIWEPAFAYVMVCLFQFVIWTKQCEIRQVLGPGRVRARTIALSCGPWLLYEKHFFPK